MGILYMAAYIFSPIYGAVLGARDKILSKNGHKGMVLLVVR